ncbi:MAG: hypothetical protein WCA35_25925 [Kovacikia sp.]
MRFFEKSPLFTEIAGEESAQINGGSCYPDYNYGYYGGGGNGYSSVGGSAISQVTTVNVVINRHRHHRGTRLPVAYGLAGVTSGALVNEYFRRNHSAG